MILQVNFEGHHYQVLTEVTEHKRYDSAFTKVNGFIKSINVNLHRNSNTSGWKLLVGWNDSSTDWVPLKDLKQSKPVELVGYAVANEIRDKPAFRSWVMETLRHQDRIISKVK